VRTPYERFREPAEIANVLTDMGQKVASTGPLSKDVLNNIMTSHVLVTGSLYMIGEAIDLLKDDFEELAFFRSLTKTTNEHR
jgi:dihydrofolate synthase/folylpolyglutamate synthase